MKKYLLFAMTFMSFICYSQEELKFVFDKKNNKIESDKTHNEKLKRIGLKEGEEYKIILERINNSIHQSVIETKPFMNNSQTPEILKTILPFTESAQVNQLFKTKDSESNLTAFNNAQVKYKQLIFLKNTADDLYAKILLTAGKEVNDTSQFHENRYCAKKKV
ncbi:hypothetical protein QSE00_24575 [Arenibacter sp. M-2]|uniref:hypothetical protein n=1 Tax=Arenibacter sp. M-2 TaxID=3053612 RepID=UPI002570881D|nr:hypothetical protein [Arenibacter sp. M-2]MDL5515008.1 hypothetical protein [Arenibacter sp. M-2]